MQIRQASLLMVGFVTGLCVAVVGLRDIHFAQAQGKPSAHTVKAEIASAKSMYESCTKSYEESPAMRGNDDEDRIYLWSLRWAHAAALSGQPKAAYAAHLERMRRLAPVRKEKDSSMPSDIAFYIAEAERMAKGP